MKTSFFEPFGRGQRAHKIAFSRKPCNEMIRKIEMVFWENSRNGFQKGFFGTAALLPKHFLLSLSDKIDTDDEQDRIWSHRI